MIIGTGYNISESLELRIPTTKKKKADEKEEEEEENICEAVRVNESGNVFRAHTPETIRIIIWEGGKSWRN